MLNIVVGGLILAGVIYILQKRNKATEPAKPAPAAPTQAEGGEKEKAKNDKKGAKEKEKEAAPAKSSALTWVIGLIIMAGIGSGTQLYIWNNIQKELNNPRAPKAKVIKNRPVCEKTVDISEIKYAPGDQGFPVEVACWTEVKLPRLRRFRLEADGEVYYDLNDDHPSIMDGPGMKTRFPNMREYAYVRASQPNTTIAIFIE